MNNTRISPFSTNRVVITRLVMIHCICCLLLRAYSHTLPMQLAQPVQHRAGYNITHMLYNLSGIGPWLTGNAVVSVLFTGSLFLFPLLLLAFPRKSWLAMVFMLLFLLFIITTNVYVNFNQHYLFLLWIGILPFCARRDSTFGLLWEGARYYACWVYGSTFILKLINGAMWQWDYGLMTMKEQIAEYVFLNPGTNLTALYTWLIQHPDLVNVGQKLVFLAEGLFLIGFFTRRYDRLLIASGLTIFITTSLFANVFFIEQLGVMIMLLLSPDWWVALKNRLRKREPVVAV